MAQPSDSTACLHDWVPYATPIHFYDIGEPVWTENHRLIGTTGKGMYKYSKTHWCGKCGKVRYQRLTPTPSL